VLRFDSKAPEREDHQELPQGFPTLNAGMAVQIGSYGCTLQQRR
jgi:hypothetical protein